MRTRYLFSMLLLLAAGSVSLAQGQNGVEVLARGPVHEAFADPAEQTAGVGPIIPREPPQAIEELPPDQKPDGDNVQWISGYWSYDDERRDFIWISGFSRVPPPNRSWVPGGWRQMQGGYQWVSGFWNLDQQQAELEYLPQPPAPLQLAPTIPAPNASHVYVPGCWVWRDHYVWRPGFWVEQRPNWIWTPAHYQWTPAGYVFIEGYWDYPLADRGVLFAPVCFEPRVIVQPTFVYTPTYIVRDECMYGALFVRRGYGHYYFGDYFEPRYREVGFSAWCGNGVGINVNIGRSYHYDPLFSYYSVTYRDNRYWSAGIHDVYAGRYRGDFVRPPRTLVQQNTIINNVTVNNITNNTIVNNTVNNVNVNQTNISSVQMLSPVSQVQQVGVNRISPLPQAARQQQGAQALQLRQVATQRANIENQLVSRPAPAINPGSPLATPQPRTAKLELPQRAPLRPTQSANVNTPLPNNAAVSQRALPTPLTQRQNPTPANNPLPRVNPTPAINPLPRVNPTPSPANNPLPRVNPTPTPANNPLPRVNPTPANNPLPRVNPTPANNPLPRVNPTPGNTGLGPVSPSNNPLPRVNPTPANNPLPRVNPTPAFNPQPIPRVNPTPANNPLPRVNPTPANNPVPRVNPTPAFNPQPRINPTPANNPLPRVNPTPAFNPQPIPRANPVPANNPLPRVNPIPANNPAPRVNPQPIPRVNPTPAKNPLPRVNPQPAPAAQPQRSNPQPLPNRGPTPSNLPRRPVPNR